MTDRILEVCVDTADGLAAAIAGGADRIELCAALSLGGLTPTTGLMKQAASVPIPVYAMIRPRSGNFVFSEDDVETMRGDIDTAREIGLAGVVLGASNADDTLDASVLSDLLARSEGLGTTLHRAIDLTPDMEEAVDRAIALGFDRILTSGGALTAEAGCQMLRKMHNRAAGQLSIMVGSGVTTQNVQTILEVAPLHEFHASCSSVVTDLPSKAMQFGFASENSKITSSENVAALKKLLRT
ncbi:MAG: copper homeostasis protein CutC [Hyphomicrobiales bacterium]